MPGIWETDAEWRRLKRELGDWRARRLAADADGQHRSQLEGCVSVIDGALDELHAPIAALTADDPRLAEHCRVHDRRVAWLRRVWEFFRERFDQRDDAALAPVLRAADEVVWSCHREPFAAPALGASVSGGPPPLPYVEPQLTPEVFPHGLVPGNLRRDIDASFLRTWLEALPFAVVRVPSSCTTAPWWLVHLGHEVGHVVDDQCLGYQARLRLVDQLHLAPAAADEWQRWSGETFADAYAALMFGPWGLWALGSAEARDDDTMLASREGYPPPAVRLLVMANACTTLGHVVSPADADLERCRSLVARHPEQAARVSDGTRVVEALLTAKVDRQTWATRTGHDPARWSSSALQPWVARLPSRPATPPGKARRVWAREVLAAGVLRRRRIEADGAAARQRFDGTTLAADLLAWLPAVREPGTRSLQAGDVGSGPARWSALARAVMAAEPLA